MVSTSSDAQAAEVDLARHVDIGHIAAHRDRDLRRRRLSGREPKRAHRHRQLHHPDGDHCFIGAHLHHPPDSAAQRLDLHEISDADLGVVVRGRHSLGRTLETVELTPLIGGELLDALSRIPRRFVARFRRRLELANRPLDISACLEEISPRLLS